MSTTSLKQRYGTPRRKLSRRTKILAIALVATVVLAWMLWVNFGKGPQAEGKIEGFSVVDNGHTTIKFQLRKPADRQASCELRAMDNTRGIVGWKVETFPVDAADNSTGMRSSVHEVKLRTDELAVSAVVDNCWISQE